VWLLRHSRVCGSDDLDRWVCSAAVTALDSVQVHVVEPLVVVRDELFRTFRE
jgi:nuclear-control-of-ATPase protein 2